MIEDRIIFYVDQRSNPDQINISGEHFTLGGWGGLYWLSSFIPSVLVNVLFDREDGFFFLFIHISHTSLRIIFKMSL